jgi:hypothetical protein
MTGWPMGSAQAWNAAGNPPPDMWDPNEDERHAEDEDACD